MVRDLGRWCKANVKKMGSSVKPGYYLVYMRRTCSRVIQMRDETVRQRLEISKNLQALWKMIENCGCEGKEDDSEDMEVVGVLNCEDG